METSHANKVAQRQLTGHEIERPEPFTLLDRIWLFYSGELVFAIMERWEVILVHAIFLALFGLLAYGLTFLPSHIRFVAVRAHYYLYGTSSGSTTFNNLIREI